MAQKHAGVKLHVWVLVDRETGAIDPDVYKSRAAALFRKRAWPKYHQNDIVQRARIIVED